MDGLWTPALYALAAWNLAVALLYGWDKRLAVRGRRRVPEATLLWVSALGGSVGMYAAMRLIHHKTQHRKFMWGIPAIFAAQVVLLILVIQYPFSWDKIFHF